jgi:hypothetical protein
MSITLSWSICALTVTVYNERSQCGLRADLRIESVGIAVTKTKHGAIVHPVGSKSPTLSSANSTQRFSTERKKMRRLQGLKQSLNASAQLVHKIDQNPAVTAEEKRQLIDTLYGRMIPWVANS